LFIAGTSFPSASVDKKEKKKHKENNGYDTANNQTCIIHPQRLQINSFQQWWIYRLWLHFSLIL
jgi:hypothetical protein